MKAKRRFKLEPQQYLTVATVNKYIKRKFDVDPHLENIFVKGEISNFKRHSSGHVYLTLKDDKAVISAVMFRQDFSRVQFAVENGMKVLVSGNITVYETAGTIQFYLKKMQLDGAGDLFVAFQQLKERLGKEGLFEARHKQALPSYPSKIVVITSPTGAAIRDMVMTIKRRFPIAHIVVIPALVQGKQSVDSIVSAILKANQIADASVVILGRGGGSIEDLWSFNEEKVARAIFASRLPIISAVGHETDVTISDFVADVRAATPTGAAELATPQILELSHRLSSMNGRILKVAQHMFQTKRARLEAIEKSYAFRSPGLLAQEKRRQLDHLAERLLDSTNEVVVNKRRQQEWMANELFHRSPTGQIGQYRTQLAELAKTLETCARATVGQARQRFINQYSVLSAVDPLKIMTRGYSAVYSSEKKPIKSIKAVKVDEKLSIKVTDGYIDCQVKATRSEKHG